MACYMMKVTMSFHYRAGRSTEEPHLTKVVQQIEKRDRAILAEANTELMHWVLYSIGFSLLPFALNALVLWLDLNPATPVTLRTVFQLRTIIFLGIYVCGTLLERINTYKPSGDLQEKLCTLGFWLYVVAAILLSAAYALIRDPVTTGDIASVGGGGSVEISLLVTFAIFMICLIAASAVVYWLLHYNYYCRIPRRANASS